MVKAIRDDAGKNNDYFVFDLDYKITNYIKVGRNVLQG
jgi:hypothetical protein